MLGELESLLAQLEGDRSLAEPDRLRQRIEALDRLDAYLLHGQLPESLARGVYDRAQAMYGRLELANAKYYQTIRSEIQRGAGREALLPWVASALNPDGEGYDYLDDLIGGVLQFEEFDAGSVRLPAEMVFYQPTPARHIFDLIRRAGFRKDDVLIDLGSGLGHVPLLASICTGVHSIGIEMEAVYVDCARRTAEALNLNSVTFLQQDARMADLSIGTVFYLYTPFTGSILRAVLDLLRCEAANREIRICSFGPCTPILAEEKWLKFSGTLAEDQVAVFFST